MGRRPSFVWCGCWLGIASLGACTSELGRVGEVSEVRAGLVVPAGSLTLRELGIDSWDLKLGRTGVVEVTGLDANGTPRGTFSHAMSSERGTNEPVLLLRGWIGTRGELRVSRRGIDQDSLTPIPGSAAWLFALGRDIAAQSDAMQPYGPATVCSELIRVSTRACTDTAHSCANDGTSAECITAARACARDSVRADRCQRRVP